MADPAGRSGWPHARALLASTSVAALLVGIGTPPAVAVPCPPTITGTTAGCTIATTATRITVTAATVSGSIVNTSTVSPNGITIDNLSVITGSIVDNGLINGGISNVGTISGQGSGSGINVSTLSTFAGAIINNGTITVPGVGIWVQSVPAFLDGISNGGVITGGFAGVLVGSVTVSGATIVLNVSSFGGGLTNQGTISNASAAGIYVSGVSTFTGGITNIGTVTGSVNGIQVGDFVQQSGVRGLSVSTFAGGITNSGTIAGAGGVGILINGVSTFSNGITNTGIISGSRDGVQVGSVINGVLTVQTFSGGVTNLGTISGGGVGVGIFIDGVSRFSGGVTNAATITGVNTGIWSENGPLFTNGISNGGTISAADFGIRVGGISASRLVSRFIGGISNSGTIAATSGIGIYVVGVSTFVGGISNTGTVTASNAGIWAAGGALHSENGPVFNGGFIGAGQAGIRVGGVGVGYAASTNAQMLSRFTGGVSNNGTISVSGGQGIVLGQISTFLGGITNSGTINALTGILINSTVSRFSGAIANTGTISGTGGTAIDLSAAGNAIIINQSAGLIAGNVKLSAFGDHFNITGGAVAGDIIGPGSSGTVNFAPGTGNSFNYSNAITGVSGVVVQSGTLFDNNAITATSVTINGGATLAPGLPGSVGTLTVNGTLAFQPGAFYLVQVTPSAASSTTVNGTASLAGTVEAAFAPGAYLSRQVSILHASGGIGGSTFDGGLTTINMSASLQASLSYGADDVFLDLTAALVPSNGGGNSQNVSAAINNFFNNGGTLPPGFVTLFGLSGPGLNNALQQLDGEVGASGGQQAGFQLTNSFLSLLLNGFFGDRSTLGAFGPAASAYASAEPSPLPQAASAFAAFDQAPGLVPVDRQRTFWASAYGGQATASGDAALATNDTHMSAVGLATGLDYRVSPDDVVGFALAGGGTGWNVANGLGSGSSDVFQAGVYGTHQFGASYVSAAAAYAWYDMSTKRTVTVSGTDTLTADFHANNLGARIEAGHRLVTPLAIGITPYAAAQVQAFWLPAYGETAASGSSQFALSYTANTATATRAELGAWFDTRRLIGGHDVSLFSRLAWAHDWNDDTRVTAVFQSLPGASFVVNGAAAPADVALVTAGAGVRFNRTMSVSVKFDGEFANAYQSYAGTAIFRYGW
jgi:uncharacterized protein with beta-barrel porin domain